MARKKQTKDVAEFKRRALAFGKENHRNSAPVAAVSHPIISARVHGAYDRQLQAELSISVLNSTRKKAGIIEILYFLKTNIEAQFI